jgi:fatty acid-binding protein DegV
MSKIALVTDSTCYIPKDLLDQYQITVAPQILIWGDETFEDGVSILPGEFYSRLKKATVMPSSSQVTVTKFQDIFQRYIEQDYQVLAILIAAKLSGTINSAVQAKAMLPEGAPIEIIDSNTTAMAMGFHVLTVARAIEQGANMDECVKLAQEASKHTGVFFAVEAVEQVRTRSKSLARIVELVEKHAQGRTPLRLATLHANAPEDAHLVLEQATQKLNPVESIFSEVSPVIGAHAGPGTVGLAFMAGL